MIKVSKEEYIKQAITLGRDLLKKNDLEGFYQLMEQKCSSHTIGLVTEFLDSKGIRLEDHLTHVPACACDNDHIPSRWVYHKRMDLPDKFKTIGNHAFGYCTDLESISLEGVEAIGEYAFANCTHLVSVKFGPDISYISRTAFLGCTRLVTFVVSNEVTAKKLIDMCRYLMAPSSQPAEIDIWVKQSYYTTVTLI